MDTPRGSFQQRDTQSVFQFRDGFRNGRLGQRQLPCAVASDIPLKVVFPFAAGGAADSLVRMLAEELQGRLGQSVVVENRAGAGGRIGVRAVVDAPPDGATVLFVPSASITLQPHLYRAHGYDPFNDLAPITQVVRFDQALVVGPDIPARSLPELLACYRATPARAAFGSPGVGTGAHFAGAALGRMGGIDLRHAPYRGTPAALPDLLGGRLPADIANLGEFLEPYKSGRLRVLATLGSERSPFLPDVPTFRESGLDLAVPSWFGMYAPARTGAGTLDGLNRAVLAALAEKRVEARIRALAFEVTATGPADPGCDPARGLRILGAAGAGDEFHAGWLSVPRRHRDQFRLADLLTISVPAKSSITFANCVKSPSPMSCAMA